MGLQVILNIQQVDDGTVLDIPGANAHLMQNPSWGGFGELYHEIQNDPDWVGIFQYDGTTLLIANREEDYLGGYESYSEVWGCFHEGVAKEFAKFVQSGKVVFRLDIEGNDTEYFICTPNNVEKKMQSDLRF